MNNIYYDYQKILSYNAFLSFLIGERGVGKTYGAIKFCISRFLKKGEQFAYIRRYKTELNEARSKIFKSLKQNNEFVNNLYNKGNTFYCDDKICGFGMTLSTAQNLKSSNYDDVKTIIFDEFIPQSGKHYLKDEVYTFLNLIETISRLRETRVILLGNADDLINPYFLYFDISISKNTEISTFKDGLILVNYMKNIPYREKKKNSRFGKLVENTPYAQFAIDNEFINNNNDFIEKKTNTAKFQFAITYKNNTYGIWFDFKARKNFYK